MPTFLSGVCQVTGTGGSWREVRQRINSRLCLGTMTHSLSGPLCSPLCSVPRLASCKNVGSPSLGHMLLDLTVSSGITKSTSLAGFSASRQDGFTLESLLQYVSVGAPWGLEGQPLKLPDLAVRSSRTFSLIANPAHELYILSPLEENVY